MKFEISPIGVIHSNFKDKESCPIQGALNDDNFGRIEVFSEYGEALETIETFSHLMLFYFFDRSGEVKLSRSTFLDDKAHGVFASRHPCRPNSIGFSIVKLRARQGLSLEVSELDVLDKTPLLDIKPYVPRFDYRPDATNGWVEKMPLRDKPKGRE